MLHELEIIEVISREGRIDGELVTLVGGGCPALSNEEGALLLGRRRLACYMEGGRVAKVC